MDLVLKIFVITNFYDYNFTGAQMPLVDTAFSQFEQNKNVPSLVDVSLGNNDLFSI